MDDRSILLMSEELRAAMGEGAKRLEESAPVTPQTPQASPTIVVLGRLIRYAALKSGRSRVTFETSTQLGDIHDLQAPFNVHLADKSVELDMTVQSLVSVTVSQRRTARYTLIVDAQTHK